MLLPVFLDHCADLCYYLDGTISHVFLLIIQETIKQWENSAADTLVAHLTEVLVNEGN